MFETQTTHDTENSRLFPMNLQLFADGEGEGTGDGGEPADKGGEGAPKEEKAPENDAERIEKLIQSRVDRLMAEERKKSANLQKQLDKLNKEKLSDDELKQLEISEREKTIAEREKALAEKENRLFAIKAIKTAGLDDGGETSLELVDFVMGENETAINDKVKTFKTLVEKMVAARVDETFKKNGRTPNGSGGADKGEPDNIATLIGKRAAETAKQSSSILNHYYGGNK